MGRSIVLKDHSAWVVPCLLLAILIISVTTACVSGSTPPQQPHLSLSIMNQTISPGSGIDISIEWAQAAVIYPTPPDSIKISLYNISDGSLLGTYTIPKTGEREGGAIHEFEGTIPGSILPEGG
jgi:hypothetical protein